MDEADALICQVLIRDPSNGQFTLLAHGVLKFKEIKLFKDVNE